MQFSGYIILVVVAIILVHVHFNKFLYKVQSRQSGFVIEGAPQKSSIGYPSTRGSGGYYDSKSTKIFFTIFC